MSKITSNTNEKIKNLKKLQVKKFRDESGEFLVENLVIIHDAWLAGCKPIALYITDELLERNDPKLSDIFKKYKDIKVMDPKVNRSFSSLSTPSGIAAVYKQSHHKTSLDKKIIYLNAINDPGNLGTILRTALAFGFFDVVIDEKCADIYNPKTVSAAKDAIFKLHISEDQGFGLFKQFQQRMKIYVTAMDGGSDIKSFKPDEKFCLVLGNEANGVDNVLAEKADTKLMIPMSGQIESLNVAVAAGIIFYKLAK